MEPLEYGNYYHIYNHAAGNRDLFYEPANYQYFLGLYDKYILPIADTYAWVLMKNHFHLLVRMKAKEEMTDCLHLTGFKNLSGVENIKPLHQYFSNLFNAYTKALNKRYETSGTLFERPFKRKIINDENYLKKVILYIHKNPVHHGFCEHPIEYPWSSYLTCISMKPTNLHRKEVIGWFGDEANFKYMHGSRLGIKEIENWLEM